MIPYKNPYALTAYYLGIFGLIPFIGLLLAIPAIILGLKGLSHRKRNPVTKGAAHAWVWIILGSISTLYNGVLVAGMIASVLGAGR